eukprot:TRINITY_DN36116_c0_g1_i1.p1 TRINITY_DN36116_c0_g1~~TRINITY_DN36116_c0_g1_i1.p1  ORF type:complete len:303 (-),score=58.23 TRINITY_DN36116_c0_g1_i1:214-1035(-)
MSQLGVCLENLPESMLSVSMLSAMLEQAGLDGDLEGYNNPGDGQVILHFKSSKASLACVKHFQGRRWGRGSSVLVRAKIMEVDTAELENQLPALVAEAALAHDSSDITKPLPIESRPPPPSQPPPPPPSSAPPPPPGLLLDRPASHSLKKQSGSVVVLIENLPAAMQSAAMLEVIMEQAGLDKMIKSCEAGLAGEVYIKFKSKEAARACIRHVQGRAWGGRSASRVQAREVPATSATIKEEEESTDAGSSSVDDDQVASIATSPRRWQRAYVC